MCGHATGSIAVEEPAAIDDGRTAEVTIGAPRRRWLIAVAVVGVAALIVTVTVFNSGHAPSATAPTTVPATTVAATTTSAPTTTVPVTSTTAAVSPRVSPRP